MSKYEKEKLCTSSLVPSKVEMILVTWPSRFSDSLPLTWDVPRNHVSHGSIKSYFEINSQKSY